MLLISPALHQDLRAMGEVEDVRLRVMGTLPESGLGAGAALIAKAVEEVRFAGRRVLWCDAREVAFGFYSAWGLGT